MHAKRIEGHMNLSWVTSFKPMVCLSKSLNRNIGSNSQQSSSLSAVMRKSQIITREKVCISQSLTTLTSMHLSVIY